MNFFLRKLGISLVVAVLLVVCRQGLAQTVTWTGAGDGGSWNQPANWSSNPSLPGPSNDVVIPAGAQGINIAIDGNPVAVRSVTLARNLVLSSNTLTVTNGVTLNGGQINSVGYGRLSFSGSVQALNGTGEIVGVNVEANAGCRLTITAGIVCRVGPGPEPALKLSTGSRIINRGILRISGAGVGFGVTNSSGTGNIFTNIGTIEAVNGGTFTIGTDVALYNEGTIVINTGGTFVCNGISSPAQLGLINRVAGASTLKVGGTFNLSGPTYTLTNATGPISFSCAWYNTTISAESGLTLQFEFGSVFSNVTITTPSVLSGSVVNGFLTVATPVVLGSLVLSYSDLTFTGGSTVLAGGLTFQYGSATLAGNAEFVSGFNSSGGVRANGCALTIGPGISFRTDSGTTGTSTFGFTMSNTPGASASILNRGSIRLSGNSGPKIVIGTLGSQSGFTFTNEGTIEVTGGSSLDINAGVTVVNSGEVVIGPSGLVFAVPNDIFSHSGVFTQTAAGRITHQINASGTALGTYGRMVVRGAANLAGTIRVQYVDGYNPQTCRAPVALISAEGLPTPPVTGTFSSTQMPPKGGMLHGVITYTSAGVNYLSTGIGDVAGLGGSPVPDGQFTADDIVVFLGAFFAGNLAIADVAMLGGAPGPDGQLTADDIILFLGSFFAGCA